MVIWVRAFLFCCFSLFSVAFGDESVKTSKILPADITFAIVDFKYNETQGVKICEIQPGSHSVYGGHDFLNEGYGLVPQMFIEKLSAFSLSFWYLSNNISDNKMREFLLVSPGMKRAGRIKDIFASQEFQNAVCIPPESPHDLNTYGAILYVKKERLDSVEDLAENYPGLIVLDAAFNPYANDKYKVNALLSSDPSFAFLKPAWMLCECKYSKDLVDSILTTIKSDMLVIKPRNGSKGNGVIILHRDELEPCLNYFFANSSNTQYINKDWKYISRYWKKQSTFLIEEFVASDPVRVEWFDNKLYDGTVRAVVLMTYHQNQINIDILEAHWKLPKKSIEDVGTLSEIHKSYGHEPHFYTIDPNTQKKMEAQLSEGLSRVYQKMLGI